MSIAKVTEIISSSPDSFDDAVNKGIKRAGKTLEHVRSAWVKDLNVVVEKGKVTEYRVTMKVSETAKRFLAKELEKLSEAERLVVERFINRGRVARNVAHEFEEKLTFGQRVADRFAQVIGSWRFIIIQSAMLAVWIALNITAYVYRWDPYPFILLNLAMSFQAAYAAPILMMSQNRQAEKDHLQAKNDYEVNLKAELEIMQLHEKFNELRDSLWVDLMRTQQRQIEMLERLVAENRAPKP
jgi:uncharacterized membrane protein/flavin-binding protein dodecin